MEVTDANSSEAQFFSFKILQQVIGISNFSTCMTTMSPLVNPHTRRCSTVQTWIIINWNMNVITGHVYWNKLLGSVGIKLFREWTVLLRSLSQPKQMVLLDILPWEVSSIQLFMSFRKVIGIKILGTLLFDLELDVKGRPINGQPQVWFAAIEKLFEPLTLLVNIKVKMVIALGVKSFMDTWYNSS